MNLKNCSPIMCLSIEEKDTVVFQVMVNEIT